MARVCALPTITDDSALGGAVIERSLTFNRDDSDHLTYTPASASTDRTKITISAWVKKCGIEQEQNIFHAGTSSDGRATLRYYHAGGLDCLTFNAKVSGSWILQVDTSAKFRDTTGWYHIVARCDTTNGTANIYVNGEDQTLYTSDKPSGSQNLPWFNNIEHQIGQRGYDNTGYMNGYMAEINVIQGQALDASYFGYTESQTNIWRPKRYAGTYGDGFYLNFSTLGETATTMGRDYSGNNNNFTPQNLEISDFSLDTPSNTFATLNPLSTSKNTLSNGNLYSTGGGSSWRPVSSDMAMSSGRWYWEVYIDTVSSYTMHGIRPQIRDDGDVNHDNDYYPGTRSDEWGYDNIGRLHNSASGPSWGDTYAAGDILGFALDMDAGTLNIYKNGSSTGSQITGISASHSPSGSRGDYLACFCVYGSTGQAIVNFGQDGTFKGHKTAQNNTDINRIGNFFYTPPTGFKALCSANLRGTSSYIIEPQKHFDVVTWTGNNTAGRLIPLEFKPDFVWVKCRTAGHDHQLTDSVRGSSKALRANAQASEEDWDVLYSGNNKGMGDYVDGGFILDDDGNNARYNNTGQTYVAWCWKGGGNSNTFNIDGTGYGTASAAGLDGGTIDPTGASVNTKAKFSVLTYTGNGSDGATIEHGLGSIPVFVIVKKRTGDNWMVYHQGNNNFSSPENYYLELNENSADINADTLFNNTAPTSSVFSLDDDSSVNSNGGSFVAYCWGEVPGYSKFGAYRGNSSSSNGSYIHLGFRPAFIIIKKFSGSDSWQMHDSARQDYNNKSAALYPSSESTETTSGRLVDFLSDGFKHYNADGNTNEDGHDYVYFAWAERAGQTPYGTFANAR
jgi:hypothetical protein